LRRGADREHESNDGAHHHRAAFGDLRKPLLEQLRHDDRQGVPGKARAQHGDRQHEEGPDHGLAAWIGLGLAVLGHRHHGSRANRRPQRRSETKTDRAGDDKGRAPAGDRRQRGGYERSAPDADAAEQTVQPKRPPVVLSVPDQPGDPDRMIDSAEQADQREADGDAERAGRKTRENGG
jgi:hypothetical protein